MCGPHTQTHTQKNNVQLRCLWRTIVFTEPQHQLVNNVATPEILCTPRTVLHRGGWGGRGTSSLPSSCQPFFHASWMDTGWTFKDNATHYRTHFFSAPFVNKAFDTFCPPCPPLLTGPTMFCQIESFVLCVALFWYIFRWWVNFISVMLIPQRQAIFIKSHVKAQCRSFRSTHFVLSVQVLTVFIMSIIHPWIKKKSSQKMKLKILWFTFGRILH